MDFASPWQPTAKVPKETHTMVEIRLASSGRRFLCNSTRDIAGKSQSTRNTSKQPRTTLKTPRILPTGHETEEGTLETWLRVNQNKVSPKATHRQDPSYAVPCLGDLFLPREHPAAQLLRLPLRNHPLRALPVPEFRGSL